jgi:hypothetical protein
MLWWVRVGLDPFVTVTSGFAPSPLFLSRLLIRSAIDAGWSGEVLISGTCVLLRFSCSFVFSLRSAPSWHVGAELPQDVGVLCWWIAGRSGAILLLRSTLAIERAGPHLLVRTALPSRYPNALRPSRPSLQHELARQGSLSVCARLCGPQAIGQFD